MIELWKVSLCCRERCSIRYVFCIFSLPVWFAFHFCNGVFKIGTFDFDEVQLSDFFFQNYSLWFLLLFENFVFSEVNNCLTFSFA